MRVINSNRGGGKTTKAVELAKKSGAHLVVSNDNEKRRVAADNPSLRIVTFYDLLRGKLRGISNPRIVIDNADDLLRLVCEHITIEAITINGPVEGSTPNPKNVEVFDPKRQYRKGEYVKFVSDD